jgi:hypothetical protein
MPLITLALASAVARIHSRQRSSKSVELWKKSRTIPLKPIRPLHRALSLTRCRATAWTIYSLPTHPPRIELLHLINCRAKWDSAASRRRRPRGIRDRPAPGDERSLNHNQCGYYFNILAGELRRCSPTGHQSAGNDIRTSNVNRRAACSGRPLR